MRSGGMCQAFSLCNKPQRGNQIKGNSSPPNERKDMSKNVNLGSTDSFVRRHIGPDQNEIQEMLKILKFSNLNELTRAAVPKQIRMKDHLPLLPERSEFEMLAEIRKIASQNKVLKTYIGMGYSDCITPPVIQRNILENPGWYTQYTPYQAEISQGRLEALLNFQTMVMDLTGFKMANASLLDESTAAAEAVSMCLAVKGAKAERKAFFVSKDCHPQTIAIVETRAEPLGIKVIVGDHEKFNFSEEVFGVLLQYPATDGSIHDYRGFIEKAHEHGALAVMAADFMGLALLTPPAELGADIAIGSAQRFGVPMGYGGPHAAYLATKDEYKRLTPGRIVGISQDAAGRPAIRLALQTREQHIRRDKATSNICTAQVLLAVIASMYAVYHGPEGIRKIAQRIHDRALTLEAGLKKLGFKTNDKPFFDTVKVHLGSKNSADVLRVALNEQVNLRALDQNTVTIALDEATTEADLQTLLEIFGGWSLKVSDVAMSAPIDNRFVRKSSYLTHPVFNRHHSETELLRYMTKLQNKDLSLTTSMIPLGSCTMKLNATAEMLPISWPEFNALHPFAPLDQAQGYARLFRSLEDRLKNITGFAAISLQPNAGSQGEYAGLLVIRKYHQSRSQGHRNVCLIPSSAHGTNPASAVMAGMKVIVVKCDEKGNVDLNDLKARAEENKANLAALMVTYPSTHGVFEEAIREICDIVHKNGGQVYMDGANMNAQVGLCRPGDYGSDVCHLNLHKTFCIPHGGGGPGMGPIGVAPHLVEFLPGHPVISGVGGKNAIGPVSAAPWGSASILPISWMYIEMMGTEGLTLATQAAILNANYIAKRLEAHYPILYKGTEGLVAHECIIDLRPLKATSGVEVMDVAKRLMDYGFHAPTVSFPVPGTMMIEPTESEPKRELDRFCDAMIAIREEIEDIAKGRADRENNVLKNAPHTAEVLLSDKWNRPYSREKAAFPASWTRDYKFWPSVSRINDVFGDRNLVCACPPIDEYS